MSNKVCTGACLECSFGMSPSVLNVLPDNRVLVSNMPAANIMDHEPIVNVAPFGMCSSIENPAVASATAAAEGVLTPMPCVPVLPAPWVPGAPQTLIANMPALTDSSKLMCAYGGVIEITMPGQMNAEAN